MSDLEALLIDLTCEDESRAEVAACAIARLGEIAFPRLESLLHSSVSDHRWWAVRTLAQMDAPPFEWLINALGDPSNEVQEAAALALSVHPNENALPALLRVLKEADGMLATLVANALISIGKAAVPELLAAFPDSRPQVRIQIMRSLAAIKDHRAISLMLKASEDDSALLNHWAQEGLEGLGLNMVYIKLE